MILGLIGIHPPIMAVNGGSCSKNRTTLWKKPGSEPEKSNFSRYGSGSLASLMGKSPSLVGSTHYFDCAMASLAIYVSNYQRLWLWPMGKFPTTVSEAHHRTVTRRRKPGNESSGNARDKKTPREPRTSKRARLEDPGPPFKVWAIFAVAQWLRDTSVDD